MREPRAILSVLVAMAAVGCASVWGITDLSVSDGASLDGGGAEGSSHGGGADAAVEHDSPLVGGGTFQRGFVAGDTGQGAPATVSPFRLDRYEVTVARFRAFADGYDASRVPGAGAGKNPNDPTDPGWEAAWNAQMPATTAALRASLGCAPTEQAKALETWSDAPAGKEDLPINCVSWFVAFAFCVWDGGRLPTEAEWELAAAGGDEQRRYPWSAPPSSTVVDGTYAVYIDIGVPQPVGSRSTKGDGKWGHADLAGNLWEWAVDRYQSDYLAPCKDCARFEPDGNRVSHGGCFGCAVGQLATSYRGSRAPNDARVDSGFRCARAP